MNKTKEIIITAIVTLGIVVLIGGYIQAYLSLPEAVLYLNDPCQSSFDKNDNYSFSVNLDNMGEVPALATMCVSSNEFMFKSSNGEWFHRLCWDEGSINPKQTELSRQPYPIIAKSDESIFDSLKNATMRFDVSCKQKVWSYGSKDCKNVMNICKYTKSNNYYTTGESFIRTTDN